MFKSKQNNYRNPTLYITYIQRCIYNVTRVQLATLTLKYLVHLTPEL